MNLQLIGNADPVIADTFQLATVQPLPPWRLDYLFTVAVHLPAQVLAITMPVTTGEQIPFGHNTVHAVGIYRIASQVHLDRILWRPITRVYECNTATVSFVRAPPHNLHGMLTLRATICQHELPDGTFLRREVYRRRVVAGQPNLAVNMFSLQTIGFVTYRIVEENMHDE